MARISNTMIFMIVTAAISGCTRQRVQPMAPEPPPQSAPTAIAIPSAVPAAPFSGEAILAAGDTLHAGDPVVVDLVHHMPAYIYVIYEEPRSKAKVSVYDSGDFLAGEPGYSRLALGTLDARVGKERLWVVFSERKLEDKGFRAASPWGSSSGTKQLPQLLTPPVRLPTPWGFPEGLQQKGTSRDRGAVTQRFSRQGLVVVALSFSHEPW